MRKQETRRRPLAGLSRWTIDRLDRDAGMARIEKVPLRRGRNDEKALEAFAAREAEPGLDRLDDWDLEGASMERLPIARLCDELGLRGDEREALSENMVFWVLLSPGLRGEPPAVYHATRPARSLSKTLYSKVTGRRVP